MYYIAYVHKDRKSDYGVSFPDFPGCVTAGRTLDEACRKATEVLPFHISGMVEDGEAIPEPSKMEDLIKDENRKGATPFLVPADVDETIRINITARSSQIKKIDRLAEQAGLSRSAFLVQRAIK